MDFFDRLKAAAHDDWQSYVDHEFVRGMGDGTLPHEAFKAYLVQDYLFLIHFSRAWALAAYKARTLQDLKAAQDTLWAILNEMNLHLRLCERWGLSAAAVEAEEEHPANVAYTRYVLDCGMSGDLLDLHVALSPCVIGYAEIGKALAPNGVEALADHPYHEWIGEYAGEGFQSAATAARATLDRLAQRGVSEERFAELAKIFAMASRLEAAFWQMGLDLGAQNKTA